MLLRLRWPLLGLLATAVVSVPTARSDDKTPPKLDELKQKELAEYKKKLAELQSKIEELEKGKPTDTAVKGTAEGVLPGAISSQFKWRNIGPANMGGRITALAVNEADPCMYWVATASGGLLKTVNNGTTFEHQFDQETSVSIGDVVVSPSNPSILYVGTGENNPRNSVSYGDGVYKSIDGGKTWKNVGLKKTYQTGKIVIHPTNPDIVYVGALGRLYGNNEDRGVFKTEDGGKTWAKVHFVDDKTGVIDMRMDPTDPNTIIAGYWEHKRDEFDGFFGTPPVPDSYGPVVTHGAGGGLFKTTDGGKTWKKLTAGLPTAKLGRIGLDYSRKTKGMIVAIIDTEKVGTGSAGGGAYFGSVMDDAENKGGAKLSTVTTDSPAAKAGLKDGDLVTKVDDKKITNADELIASYQEKKAGDKIKITILREMKEQVIEVTLGTRPVEAPAANAPVPTAGFSVGRGGESGVPVSTIVEGGPAAKAGLKDGDVITAIDGKGVSNIQDYRTALTGKKEGDKAKFTVKRGMDTKEFEVVLGAPAANAGGPVRGQNPSKPYGLGLGGQQPNVQTRQGKDGFETGGIFLSKDNGDTWTRVNSLNPRPMYFSQIRIDPTDDKTLYVLCDTPSPIYRSTDGGARFENMRTAGGVHADAHSLWINPKDGRHLIIGGDGGFYVTFDKGEKWDHLNNFALGQFYHIAVDNRKPYRVYGGLQDNGSWGGPSDTLKRTGPVNEDWVFVSGGDGFVCRVDQTDPDLVYTESQGGAISRRNYRTGEQAGIRPPRADNAEALRFNWNTPFILSSHNPGIFYNGAQFVFRSVKKGDELKQISPDLTRTKAGSMIALAESPKNPDILWAGTDDGFVWVTKDGGVKWENVTENIKKAGLPDFRCVGTIEPSRDKLGRCYIAFDAHRSNDDKPYLFVTDDQGATWKPISGNLPEFGSTRCLREDYVNPNILYCGTEFGAYVSLNRGGSWAKLGGGLPTVACHEFAQPTTANELVVGTHGRSVWVLDINAIRQMKTETLTTAVTLFTPSPAVRWRLNANGASPYSETDRKFAGENPTRGATIDLFIKENAKKASLKVLDVTGKTVWEYSGTAPATGGRPNPDAVGAPGAPATTRAPGKALTESGLHRINWNLSSGGGGGRGGFGNQARAGVYKVLLTVDDKEYTQSITIELDPNLPKDAILTEYDEESIEAERKAKKKDSRRDE
jgi:photosystem II stability/assembly factor-like uncharacterized protein